MSEWEKPSGNMIMFLEELKTLLEKYKYEINADDEWQGYSECGQDIQIRIDSKLCETKDNFSVPFGNFIDSKKIDKILEDAKK